MKKIIVSFLLLFSFALQQNLTIAQEKTRAEKRAEKKEAKLKAKKAAEKNAKRIEKIKNEKPEK